jgi:hypothetical protein
MCVLHFYFDCLFDTFLKGREAGRPALFTSATIAACREEFFSRVTSIKRGMANAALKEMLIRKRKEIQTLVGVPLDDPSDSCLEDAIKLMDISPPVSADPATKDRADALEDYRNSVSCAAMFTAIQKMNICPALLFGLDEVSCWLTQRGTKIRFCRYPKHMLKEAKERKLSAGCQVKKVQPRCMYIECLVNAEGDLVSTIVRCVDDSIPKNKFILKAASASNDLFVCFVNKDYDKAAFSKTMMTRVWLPKIRNCQDVATANLRSQSDAGNVPEFDSPFFSQGEARGDYKLQDGESVLRALLTFDGAYEHIEAIMTGSMADYCRKHNIGLFKWAAGCSLVQQPADVSKCHKLIHSYFKKPRFVYNVTVQRSDLRAFFRPVMHVLDKHKAKSATKTAFCRFFYHLPDALHCAFLPCNVREGFGVCGLYPFDVEKIMAGWNPGGPKAKSTWSRLLPNERAYFRVAIESLSEIALQKGFVSDDEIDYCVVDHSRGLTLGQVMEDAPIPDYLKCQIGGTKENPGKGINRRRCILMTHASWLGKERQDRRLLPPKVVDIYGKDFELKKCKCGSKAFSNVATHVKLLKHQQHCAALVESLRNGQVISSEEQDSAVTLARRYYSANPVAVVNAIPVDDMVEVRDGEEMGFAASFDGAAVPFDGANVDMHDADGDEVDEEDDDEYSYADGDDDDIE